MSSKVRAKAKTMLQPEPEIIHEEDEEPEVQDEEEDRDETRDPEPEPEPEPEPDPAPAPAPPSTPKPKRPQTEKQKEAFEKCKQARAEKMAEKRRLKAEMDQAVGAAKQSVLEKKQKEAEAKRLKDLEKTLPKDVKLSKVKSTNPLLGQEADEDAKGFIKSLRRLIEEEVSQRTKGKDVSFAQSVTPMVKPAAKKRRTVPPQGVREQPAIAFM